MIGMDSEFDEVGPTEGTILALLDFLVDPLLPSRCSSREIISPSQEELVAKQVHAVVLLYNYYHRKRYPELEFLEFVPFCQKALVLKPSLLSYLKLMQREDYAKLEDQDKQLSLTEEAIMNGCDICKSLDASNKNPVIEGWPISKVAVFLVDSKKENCYLFHSSITQGVWSVIEKDITDQNQNSEAVTEAKTGNKKKRVIKRAPKETSDEASLQQFACLAVKEACGINQGDLKTLENHMVYSTGKKQTAVRLYIMQCTQTNHDMNLVPINDAMESEGLINTSQHLEVAIEDENCNSHFKVETLPNTSHSFQVLKEVENCDSSQKEVEPLANSAHYSEAVKEVENHNGYLLEVEPLSNTSHHCEAVKKVENHNHSLLNKDQPLDTLQPSVVVKEFSNGNSDQLKEETLQYTLPQPVALKVVENHNHSLLNEEQLLDTLLPSAVTTEDSNGNSDQLEEKTLQYTLPQPEALKVVGNHDDSLLNEEQRLDTLQPSSVTKEDGNGNSDQLEEKTLQYTLQQSEAVKEEKDSNNSRRREERTETVVYKKRKRSQKSCNYIKNPDCTTSIATKGCPRQEGGECATGSSNNMDIDESVMTCPPVDGESKIRPCGNHVDHQKQMVLPEETDQTALTGGAIVVAEAFDNLPSSEHTVEKVFSDNKISDSALSDQDKKQDHALVCFNSNFEHLHKIQLTIASKAALLSQTALKVLFRKREILSQQLRSIADDIALCDKNIETILNGGEDDLAVKIDSLIEGCNHTCLRSVTAAEDERSLHISDQDLPPVGKRKRLSEANLCVHNPCQDLDGICNENSWKLPNYLVSALEDGFQASVTMKGVDFECSSEGDICATPCEARNSAAFKLLVKLRSMAAES